MPVGDFAPPIAGEELGVLEDVGDGHDRAGEEAGVLGSGDGVELGDVGEEGFDGFVDLVAELRAAGREAVVVELGEERFRADPFEQAGEARAGAHDVDVAVGAGIDAEADAAAALDGAAGVDAGVGGAGELDRAAVAAAGLAAVDGDVEPIAGGSGGSGFGAAEGEEDGEGGGRAGVVGGVVAGELERFAGGVAGGVERAADGLEGELGAAVGGVGAFLPVGGDGAEDERGIDGAELVPAPAVAGGLARREVFDDDVDLGSEAADGGRAVIGVRVEDDGLLVGVEVEEEA